MKAPKKKVAIICSLSLLLIGIGMWFFIPKNGLLDRAILVANGPEWIEPTDKSAGIPVYEWINSEEVLLFRPNADQRYSLFRKRVLPLGKGSVAELLPVELFLDLMYAHLLPDKQTLELDTYQNKPTQWRDKEPVSEYSHFVSMETGRLISEFPYWCSAGPWNESDSSFWNFTPQGKPGLEVTHLLTGKIEKRALKAKWGINLNKIYAESIDRSGRLIAFSYIASTIGAPLPPETAVEFNIYAPNIPARQWVIPAPPDSIYFNGTFSPARDRILWDTASKNAMFPYNVAQRLPGRWKPIPKFLERWMVSDIYGHGMHTIAEAETVDSSEASYSPIYLEWNPDGKHVSFLHKDGLYLLPID